MASGDNNTSSNAGEESLSDLLEVTPDSALQFFLTKDDSGEASTPKCIMTLKHPGGNQDNIAFKVLLSFFCNSHCTCQLSSQYCRMYGVPLV